jgi:predicted dehydrogenase
LGYNEIDVVDIDEERLNYIKENFKIRNTSNDFLKPLENNKYDVAFVLTPPSSHIPIAIELAKRGIDLFIEKPISANLEGINELLELKKKNNLIIMVGYNQRFNIGIKEIKQILNEGKLGKIYYIRAEVGQYLPDWRPWQDYRESYTSIKELGGGILLDGSHEIDYVLWLINREVEDIMGLSNKVSNMETDVEDVAEIIFWFDDGSIGSIHLDMLNRKYTRYVKIIGENGSVQYDFKSKILEYYNINSNYIFKKIYEDYDINQTYVDEIKHFFSSRELRKEPLASLAESIRVLSAILKIKESTINNQEKKARKGLNAKCT